MRLGKDKQAIFIAGFLLLSASAGGQAVKSYKYQIDGSLQKTNVISEGQSLIINYSISDINIESFTNENGSFYRVSIPGHTPVSSPGKPELPLFSRLITIPEGSDYKIIISDVRSTRINPSGKKIKGILYPVQEGETKNNAQKPQFLIDKAAYAERSIISSDTVRIESLGKVRNNNLSNIIICPARYNPHKNYLEVITSMKIEITNISSGIGASKSDISGSALFSESLDKSVLNYNKADVIPGYTEQPVKMIILTDTSFRKHLDPFIRWKTQKGFDLKVLYKGKDFAGNTYTELKDTLTKIYRSATNDDPAPEYLLIIGDVNRIPYYGSGNVTDLYYAEFDGNGDYIPEMYIGRLPVSDTIQLKTVVDKIIQYEKFQFADTNKFYSQALVTAGVDGGNAGIMNGQVYYSVNNYLNSANNLNGYNFYYPQSANSNVEDSVKKLINEGLSFINYTGHGQSTGWVDPALRTGDVDSLKNRNMYPFMISNACQTSIFSLTYSFGNKMVLTEGRGAIGYIGCSNDSYWDEDFYWSVGPGAVTSEPTYESTGLGAYDRLFHTHQESPSEWYVTMGQVNFAGNMAVSASSTSKKKMYWEIYNLVGDPSVIPIIGKPGTFNIELPDTLPNGMKSLSLMADPFSYISVSHFDTLWDASYVSASGSIELGMPGLSDDSCLVVVTGQNKLPLIKTIYFSDVSDEFISLAGNSINDIQGNNNRAADYGETVFLNIKVRNLGLTDATNVYSKISSSSEYLTIENDSVFIGTLQARSELVIPDQLKIMISKDATDMSVASLQLLLKDDRVEKSYTIDICIHAPQLQIISCVIDDTKTGNGDYIADPGETYNLVYRIRNQGSSNASGNLFVTTSDNGKITIFDYAVKSGVLKFGEITEIPVMVKLSETVATGTIISISSTLICDPYRIINDFSFKVGKIRESFEAESFNIFPWINNSKIPWITTSDGSYDGTISARSGAIGAKGTTSLMIKTFYSSDDSIRFIYKVSSEPGYDFLSFQINGKEILKKSGETGWVKFAAPVKAGFNEMVWKYFKDGADNRGYDCAWIDMIDFSISGSLRYIEKDLLIARIVPPLKKNKFKQETITVKVHNIGKDTINGFNLAYEINDQLPPVKEFFKSKVIPFGDTVTVSFSQKADISRYGVYDVTSYGFDNDDYIFNDTTRLEITNTEIADSLILFPNPFTEQFTLYINSRIAESIIITITNSAGAEVYEMEKEISAGKNPIIIKAAGLSPSVYYVTIRNKTSSRTLPVLKLKE